MKYSRNGFIGLENKTQPELSISNEIGWGILGFLIKN